jgi:peptidyl-tRNA hydrolase, PTH1 family
MADADAHPAVVVADMGVDVAQPVVAARAAALLHAHPAVRFLKIPLERVVVFHDELDLAPGRVRMKKGGGAGGHNGLRDIDAHVGNDYRRVRIGIGHPGHKDLVLHWVLRDFEPDERDPKTGWLPRLLAALAEESALLVEGGAKADERYMSRVTHLAPPPKPPAEESKA